MLSSFRSRNINCEEEAKFAQERILKTEKHLAEFCDTFAQYSRKAAKVRDKGDSLAEVFHKYAETENINASLSEGLSGFAAAISTVSDYGDVRVQNIDNKVVKGFSRYANICKHAKEEVRQIFNARDKELTRKKQLDRIRERNPRNRQQIIQAETELVKATAEVARTIHSLEDQITNFEKEKLQDIKTILLDFIATEMGYHAKALELLTKAYQEINDIDEEFDLQEFKKSLQEEALKETRKPQTSPFRTSRSLGSINTLFNTNQRTRSPGIPIAAPRMFKQTISKSSETLHSRNQDASDTEDEQKSTSDNTDESQEKPSPFIAKKFLK